MAFWRPHFELEIHVTRVNIGELADIIGVARNTVTSWLSDGLPYAVAGDRGVAWQFDTKEALLWWAEHKVRRRTVQAEEDGLETYEQAERRKMVAAADRAELDLAKATSKVVLIEDVVGELMNMHALVRTRMLGIGNHVRTQVRSVLGGDRAAEEQIVGTVEQIVADAMAEIRDDPFGNADEDADFKDGEPRQRQPLNSSS
jgi:phage terminase Nu1 subunit (DNA packaging protein)